MAFSPSPGQLDAARRILAHNHKRPYGPGSRGTTVRAIKIFLASQGFDPGRLNGEWDDQMTVAFAKAVPEGTRRATPAVLKKLSKRFGPPGPRPKNTPTPVQMRPMMPGQLDEGSSTLSGALSGVPPASGVGPQEGMPTGEEAYAAARNRDLGALRGSPNGASKGIELPTPPPDVGGLTGEALEGSADSEGAGDVDAGGPPGSPAAQPGGQPTLPPPLPQYPESAWSPSDIGPAPGEAPPEDNGPVMQPPPLDIIKPPLDAGAVPPSRSNWPPLLREVPSTDDRSMGSGSLTGADLVSPDQAPPDMTTTGDLGALPSTPGVEMGGDAGSGNPPMGAPAAPPPPAAAGGAPMPPMRPYLIQKGDTLWDIAEKVYGQPQLWPIIANANPQIKDPNLIYAGKTIKIPAFSPEFAGGA